MSFHHISPFRIDETRSTNLLIVGAEGTGKHDIAKVLVGMGSAINLKVHTCTCLPLAEDSTLNNSSVHFVCFFISQANKESMKVTADSIGQLDVKYFLGRSVIVANTKGATTDEGVSPLDVTNFAAQYDVPVLFRNTEVEAEKIDLCRRMMRMIETAVGWRANVSPLLFDAVRVSDRLAEDRTAMFTPSSNTTPALNVP